MRAAARPAPVADEVDFDRLLSDMSDDSVDGLIAALEAELERQRPRAAKPSPVAEVLADAGIGQSPRDLVWAAWGFSGGFAANVVLAKYAQMQSGAPITDFLMPMLLGGLLCGGACAAIGWGLARLRDR